VWSASRSVAGVARDGSGGRRRRWRSATTRRITLLTVPLLVIFGTAAVGNAAAPALVEDRPLLLLALNATTRHLVLTSTSVAVVPWVLIGLGRRLVEDPFLYLLGRWHGDDALAWIERKAGGGRWLQLVRRRFRLLGYPLVAIAPGGVVCLLAGASGMHPIPFVLLDLVGTLVVLAALRSFGAQATEPIDATVALIGELALPLTAVTAAATALWAWRRRKAAPPRASDR
jgi:membrane protein DedA with SNARE-associated domain